MSSAVGVGSEVGEFVIVRPLAQGGMGAVYVARQRATGALRALKILHPRLGDDPRIQARFEQEARVGALIPSDHVVEVVAAGIDGTSGIAWLAMELLEGMDLAAYIAQRGRLAAPEVLEILSQVAHALSAAHGVGIVHRDLKPENVLLATRRMVGVPYMVKLLDFGIAKLLSESSRMTAAVGTPAYMAPEQTHRSGDVSAATDVWALGLLAFEMLTGASLWRGVGKGDTAGLFREVLLDPIPSASERAAEELVPATIPAGFDAWMARCVVRNPSERFESVRQALAALMPLLRARTDERPAFALPSPSAHLPPLASAEASTLLRGAPATSAPMTSAPATSAPTPSRIAKRALRVIYRDRFGRTVVPGEAGASILEVSVAHDVPHHRVCGGKARCTTCRVVVHEGAELLDERTDAEAKVARARGWGSEVRLACQARMRPEAKGDVVVRRLVVDRQDADDAQAGSGEVESLSERHAVVLVARLDGLTSFAARHLPYDAMHVAARAFRTISELVRAHRGEVLAMHGTRLVAVFGAPGDDVARSALDATRAAVRMEPRMALVNDYLGQNFGEAFTLAVGMHVGTVFVGALADDASRAPTLLGEAIEVSEQIASRASAARVSIAASPELVRVLGDVVAVGRSLDPVEAGGAVLDVLQVKGFEKPDVTFLVQSSFERLLPVADEFSQRFYERLFEIAPDTRPMFAHVEMAKQRRMLMDVIAAAVRGLDDLPGLIPTLQALGRRHVGYGVSTRHYRAVGEALLGTLEAHFGDALTPEMHLAWLEVYGTLARTMIEAARGEMRAA